MRLRHHVLDRSEAAISRVLGAQCPLWSWRTCLVRGCESQCQHAGSRTPVKPVRRPPEGGAEERRRYHVVLHRCLLPNLCELRVVGCDAQACTQAFQLTPSCFQVLDSKVNGWTTSNTEMVFLSLKTAQHGLGVGNETSQCPAQKGASSSQPGTSLTYIFRTYCRMKHSRRLFTRVCSRLGLAANWSAVRMRDKQQHVKSRAVADKLHVCCRHRQHFDVLQQ